MEELRHKASWSNVPVTIMQEVWGGVTKQSTWASKERCLLKTGSLKTHQGKENVSSAQRLPTVIDWLFRISILPFPGQQLDRAPIEEQWSHLACTPTALKTQRALLSLGQGCDVFSKSQLYNSDWLAPKTSPRQHCTEDQVKLPYATSNHLSQ